MLSLTAFEVSLFGWMALMHFVFFPAPHHLHPDSPAYWSLMQVGMIAGFFTAWPVNAWLIRIGIRRPCEPPWPKLRFETGIACALTGSPILIGQRGPARLHEGGP